MPTPRGPDADKRSEERRQAEKMFLDSNGNAKLVDIAEKLKLPPNKIRKWKSMDKRETKMRRGIITLCRLRIPPSMEGILRCTGTP